MELEGDWDVGVRRLGCGVRDWDVELDIGTWS